MVIISITGLCCRDSAEEAKLGFSFFSGLLSSTASGPLFLFLLFEYTLQDIMLAFTNRLLSLFQMKEYLKQIT